MRVIFAFASKRAHLALALTYLFCYEFMVIVTIVISADVGVRWLGAIQCVTRLCFRLVVILGGNCVAIAGCRTTPSVNDNVGCVFRHPTSH